MSTRTNSSVRRSAMVGAAATCPPAAASRRVGPAAPAVRSCFSVKLCINVSVHSIAEFRLRRKNERKKARGAEVGEAWGGEAWGGVKLQAVDTVARLLLVDVLTLQKRRSAGL